ncbi:MAG: hypothetical protein ACI4TX_04140 [Christensenellales bacterium]
MVLDLEDNLATGKDAEQLVQEEKKEVRYKKIDSESGYLTDEVEIGNFKIYQRRDIVENLLLGDYNQNGDYVLNSKILKGLVGIRKEKSGDYSQIIFLNSVESFAQKGKLKFSISISDVKEQEGYKIAVLKLLEPVKKMNGYIENTNSFIVASYKDKGDEAFNSKVAKVFHIVDTSVDEGMDDPEIVNSIIERLKFLNNYKSIYLNDIASQEQAYYYARLELLKDPRFEEILIEYKKHLTKASMFIDPSSNDYYAKLNELLDLSIDIVASRNKELGILVNQTLRPIVEKHNEVCESKHNIILEKAKNPEQQKASDAVLAPVMGGNKSKGGGKPASKGKSAGGSGKSGGGKPASKGGKKDKGGQEQKQTVGNFRFVSKEQQGMNETTYEDSEYNQNFNPHKDNFRQKEDDGMSF